MFPKSMACFFIFLSVFLMNRAFTCVKINLSILSFLFGNFLSYKRNFPYNKIKKIFFNVFSRRHEHLDFMFMTMIHSKYFVCYKVGVKIIFSPYEYTVVQAEFVEKFPFQMECLRAFYKNQSSI